MKKKFIVSITTSFRNEGEKENRFRSLWAEAPRGLDTGITSWIRWIIRIRTLETAFSGYLYPFAIAGPIVAKHGTT